MKTSVKFGVILMVMLSIAHGCRRSNTPAPPPAVAYDEGPDLFLTLDGNEVVSFGESATRNDVEELPQDIPPFAEAELKVVSSSPQGHFVVYHDASPSRVTFEELTSTLASDLQKAGWTIKNQLTSGETQTVVGEKEGRELNVLIDRIEGGWEVTVAHRNAPSAG